MLNNTHNKKQNNFDFITSLKALFSKTYVKYLTVLLCLWAICPMLVYYWRVFYYYGQYNFALIQPSILTLGLMLLCALGVLITFILNKCIKSFSTKAAVAVFCVGLLFVFVSPPLQVPDETEHYLRAVAISEGRFNFDANRTYDESVDATVQAFYNAWTNRHDGSPIKARSATEDTNIAPEEAIQVEAISSQFVDYHNIINGITPLDASRRNSEPVLFVVLPLIPQAIGAFLARLLGFGGLGMLYGARIGALLIYALLCKAALKNCRRYRALFCAIMLLPLSLYMAASCSYDSIMLGLYFFAASYFCKDEITDKDIMWFALALALMATVKINNLVWIVLPLVLPKTAWKAKLKKWQAASVILAAFGVLYGAITMYNTFAIVNYGEIGRMIEGVSQSEQIAFMLSNPLRTIAAFWGTLMENEFFFSQMGLFGNIDTPIALINVFSPLVLLLCSALSVHRKSSLPIHSSIGLLGLAVIYVGANLAGLYVTYTPLQMVRVIGLQARYFIPVFLMLFVLLSGLLSHVLTPQTESELVTPPLKLSLNKQAHQYEYQRGTKRALNLGFGVALAFGIIGALLLFQTYFVGPVTITPFVA